MSIHTRVTAGLIAVAATSSIVFGAGHAVAQPLPEVRWSLIGLDQVGVYWQTYGRLGCRMIAGIGGIETPGTPIPVTKFTIEPAPPFSMRYQVRCPDGTRSPWARYYGPRDPLNDMRTTFNGATMDLFGV